MRREGGRCGLRRRGVLCSAGWRVPRKNLRRPPSELAPARFRAVCIFETQENVLGRPGAGSAATSDSATSGPQAFRQVRSDVGLHSCVKFWVQRRLGAPGPQRAWVRGVGFVKVRRGLGSDAAGSASNGSGSNVGWVQREARVQRRASGPTWRLGSNVGARVQGGGSGPTWGLGSNVGAQVQRGSLEIAISSRQITISRSLC